MNRRMRVWAPGRAIELVVGDSRHAMTPVEHGWHEVDAAEPALAAGYAYSIDGGDPRPDPRSAFQPDGVHAASHLVDYARFDWTDGDWAGVPFAEAVIYELHVGTFTSEGTFTAAIKRLDHLVELGVNAIELMPVAPVLGSHGWGYDGVDLYAPHGAYGGPDGLWQLVDACHARGLAVVLDVVYNHLGPEGNYLDQFGPYFTDHYQAPWGPALNYDRAGSDEVRAFVVDNVEHWVRNYHCDGVRLDAVHAIYDSSATHLLEAIAARVKSLRVELRRELWVIAESDLNDPRPVRDQAAGGYGLTAQWSDDFHHALHALLSGERTGYYADFGGGERAGRGAARWFRLRTGSTRPTGTDPRQAIRRDPVASPSSVTSRTTTRSVTAPPATGAGRGSAPDGCAWRPPPNALSPFTPMLFMGEEWSASTPFQYFTDFPDTELGRAVRTGRRREFAAFGWDPAGVPDSRDPATFARSKLNWDEVGREPHASILSWYRQLLALRRRLPGLGNLVAGEARVAWDEAAKVPHLPAVRSACRRQPWRRDRPHPHGRRAPGEPALAWPGDVTGGIAPDGTALWFSDERERNRAHG